MKLTIEIWQNKFNSEWNCDITTITDSQSATEYWAVDDFCALLSLVGEKIPSAKCVSLDKPTEYKSCEHSGIQFNSKGENVGFI